MGLPGRLGGAAVAQRFQRAGKPLAGHRHHAGDGVALHLLAAHRAGQIVRKQVGGRPQRGLAVAFQRPALVAPHAVGVQQQLHPGVLLHGGEHCLPEGRGIAGVHRAEAQRDEIMHPGVIVQTVIVIPQQGGQLGVGLQLGAQRHAVQIGPQVLVAKQADAAVIRNAEGALHQRVVAVAVTGLSLKAFGQLHAVAAPAARDGQTVVHQIQRGQQMGKVNALSVWQNHRAHALQHLAVPVIGGHVGLKFRVPDAGGELPDIGVVLPHTGVGQRQHHGVGGGVHLLHKGVRQRLEPSQPIQHRVILSFSVGGRGKHRQQQRRQKPPQGKKRPLAYRLRNPTLPVFQDI